MLLVTSCNASPHRPRRVALARPRLTATRRRIRATPEGLFFASSSMTPSRRLDASASPLPSRAKGADEALLRFFRPGVNKLGDFPRICRDPRPRARAKRRLPSGRRFNTCGFAAEVSGRGPGRRSACHTPRRASATERARSSTPRSSRSRPHARCGADEREARPSLRLRAPRGERGKTSVEDCCAWSRKRSGGRVTAGDEAAAEVPGPGRRKNTGPITRTGRCVVRLARAPNPATPLDPPPAARAKNPCVCVLARRAGAPASPRSLSFRF